MLTLSAIPPCEFPMYDDDDIMIGPVDILVVVVVVVVVAVVACR